MGKKPIHFFHLNNCAKILVYSSNYLCRIKNKKVIQKINLYENERNKENEGIHGTS